MEQQRACINTRIDLGVLVTRGTLVPPEKGHDWLDLVSAGSEDTCFGQCRLLLMPRAGGSWWSRLDPPEELGLPDDASEELGPFESEREAVRAVALHALDCLVATARLLDVEPKCS